MKCMIWKCRIQRKGERVERVGVRTCVGVGGRVNKNIWAKGYQHVYVFNLNMSPSKSQVSTWHVFQTCRVISFFDCYCAQVLCATQQSPIQSQFEQSLLTVQNAAQRTFSLLFPLLRLGRSAQVSCAVRGPFVISSLRMDLYLSELYHHLCDLQSVWGKNYLPVVGSYPS